MRLSQPSLRLLSLRLASLMSLMLLAGVSGCGPASSDKSQNLGTRASVSGTPQADQSSPPRNGPVTPSASPLPLASVDGTGSLSGRGIVSGGAPVASSKKPADPVDTLNVPAWIAKDLDSPDVGVRIRALETWAQSAPPGAVDPLIVALDDHDERVQARAMELIDQDWARAADVEQSGEEAGDTSGVVRYEDKDALAAMNDDQRAKQ